MFGEEMKSVAEQRPEIRAQDDHEAIQALMQGLFEAWAAGDADAYADLFTEDADYIAFDGVNQKGRAAIAEGHRPLFERWLRGSRLIGSTPNIRFLAPEVALIHARGDTLLAGKATPELGRESVQTLVAVNRDGRWRFTAFHNTRSRPIQPGPGGVIAWKLADLAWRVFGAKAVKAGSPK